jgi:esterase/lipase superfamily enzyme
MVTVYYATTRADLPFAKFANGFDGVDLRYGTAEVEVGNELFAPEPKILTETKWTTSGEEVLVFVHGFNNTFADAVQAGARLKQGLEWPGPLIVFSWASWGQVVLYTKDETLQAAAVTPFVGFLQGLEVCCRCV